MYVRVSTVNKGQRAYQYLQIVEAYRDNGGPRQRVVASLGRLDQLGEKVDQLVCSLSNYCKRPRLAPDQITCREALAWGPVLVARHLWEQVGLGEIIGRLCRRRKFASQVAEQAFVLVANRLTAPSSEHGLARWPLTRCRERSSPVAPRLFRVARREAACQGLVGKQLRL